jgi:hypothetical protein
LHGVAVIDEADAERSRSANNVTILACAPNDTANIDRLAPPRSLPATRITGGDEPIVTRQCNAGQIVF